LRIVDKEECNLEHRRQKPVTQWIKWKLIRMEYMDIQGQNTQRHSWDCTIAKSYV
jgi:hypothetical protein